MSQTIDLLKNSSFEDGMDLLETAIDGVASAISELSVNKSLNDLTNVNIRNPQNDQVLSYNNGVWVNSEGGGDANDVELTKNEYDALPDSKYTDDINYYITDWSEDEKEHPYLSLERLDTYLYKVTFENLPQEIEDNPNSLGGCSSYVKDGKLYRNLDFNYDSNATFQVVCNGFEGTAFRDGLTNESLDDDLIAKLPYQLVDGRNDNGIMVSMHVLFNDWDWQGSGNIPLYKVPYLVLKNVKSMETIETDLGNILSNLCTYQALDDNDYLLQFIVTDGTTTYAILPPTSSSGAYVIQDITDNPKLTNFRWVNSESVVRTDLQNRPTGVERWNLIPTASLEDLRFTKAYETADRLSEFIGIDETTKDSTDEELMSIYEEAKDIYDERTRDGRTWQTMCSIIYSNKGIEKLCVQENWNKDFGNINSSGNANVWYGSHAEYAEEKTQIADETTLLFNDDIGLEAESDYYSEVEQVIGTYLGKPLYRKCFTFNMVEVTTTGVSLDIHIPNAIYKNAIASCNTSPYANRTFNPLLALGSNNQLLVRYFQNQGMDTLVLEYTKTTDSVVGVVGGIKKGDNYSTNEQVIGTWIDGKPLYRKTFDLGIMGNPVSKSIDVSSLNIKVCAKMYGEMHHTTQSTYNFRPLPMVDILSFSNQVRIDIVNNNLRATSSGDWGSYNGTITLEYTKTTD